MASPKSTVSKTARASTKTTTKQRAVPAADIDRLVPLADGNYAYVYFPNGRSPRFKTTSPEFIEAIREVTAQGYGDRVRTQVEALAAAQPASVWVAVRDALAEAGAYDA